MTLNPLLTGGELRAPRAVVRLSTSFGTGAGATAIPGWISWSVSSNSYYEADTFRVSFATSALPAGNDAGWFMEQDELYCEILAGFPQDPNNPNAAELTSLTYGRVDEIEFDPAGFVINITGRDLVAGFIDTKTSFTWQNQTAAQIVTYLANAHGITVVATPSAAYAGKYFDPNYVLIRTNVSEWDVICELARANNFVARYTRATGLYFGPDPTDTTNPYVIQWTPPSARSSSPQANVREISFSRSLTVTKGITVTVQSASMTKKTPVTASYPSKPKPIAPGKATPFGAVQPYSFNLSPGSTAADCGRYAQAKYHEITSHAMKLRARLPADNLLSLTTPIRVQGTGTPADQMYFPRHITRQMSLDEGYVMDIEAQNTTPQLEQQLQEAAQTAA